MFAGASALQACVMTDLGRFFFCAPLSSDRWSIGFQVAYTMYYPNITVYLVHQTHPGQFSVLGISAVWNTLGARKVGVGMISPSAFPKRYRSVLVPSSLSSNRPWKTATGGCDIHHRVRYCARNVIRQLWVRPVLLMLGFASCVVSVWCNDRSEMERRYGYASWWPNIINILWTEWFLPRSHVLGFSSFLFSRVFSFFLSYSSVFEFLFVRALYMLLCTAS